MENETIEGELYTILKDLKFADVFRIQESPSDIYLARLKKMGIEEGDWNHFIDVINGLTQTEATVPPPSKTETVDEYIIRVAQHQAAREEGKK